ncbi:flippase [Persephonella sp.]
MFKKFINAEYKKRIFANFLSLSVLQGANYILPLITLPYLVRVLGPEKFGLVMFAQAFIQYFIILTDYGFNLSATKEISVYRNDKEKVSEIFTSVMLIKILLLFFSFLLMTLIIISFEKFKEEWLIYYLTFGMVIGQVLFPIWFFQGIEEMKYITIINIISKLIFTILVFLFVNQTSDYILVAVINSLGYIVAGVISIWIVYKKFKISLKLPSSDKLIFQLKEGWHIFISTLAISLYTVSNTFILGIFTNNTIVGYYSAAEKLIKAAIGLLTPFSQAIYPYISKLMSESKEKGILFIKKITFYLGIISLLSSILLYIFAEPLTLLILGDKYIESIIVVKILSFLPFVIALSNIFGIQTMVTLNYKKAFSNILISASIINIILALTLVPIYKHIGISTSVLISEVFVTISMFIYLHKKGVRILEGKIV